jgi:hypothetical protein
LEEEGDWSKYHHMLNRAKWDELQLSAILLHLIVDTFVACKAVVYFTVDETLERCWGPKISKRGHWRDSLAPSRKMSVSTSGLRWLSFAVVVKVPWSPLNCSLPFLHVLLTTPKVSAERGLRHRIVAQRTMQVVCWFAGLTLAREPVQQTTTMTGPVGDQAALHGVLARIRDLGLPLLFARWIDASEEY